MEPVRPDYDGASIAGVVPALVRSPRADWLPAPVAGARAVVLVVVDGLGWEILEAHRRSLPTLDSLVGGPITTVVPSTTASALTSLTTGAPPARHGITGFRMVVDGSVLGTLSWRTDDGARPPEPDVLQRLDPFLGRSVVVVTRSEFRTTGFTAAHLRGCEFRGWEAPSALAQHCRAAVEGGARLVYAYYPGLDSVAHAHGLDDRFFSAELLAVDRLLADVRAAVPPDVVVVVTADHGHVTVGEGGWIGLGPLDRFVEHYAGEGRFRYLHARRESVPALAAAAADHSGADAWVFSREELLDDGWLGRDPAPGVARRVGDVILAAKGTVAFVDPTYPREMSLVGAHGSLTAGEMLVPLLAGRGNA